MRIDLLKLFCMDFNDKVKSFRKELKSFYKREDSFTKRKKSQWKIRNSSLKFIQTYTKNGNKIFIFLCFFK